MGSRRRRAHRPVRRARRRRRQGRRCRTGSPSPWHRWSAWRRVGARGSCAPSPARRRVARGHAEPRLAAARLGVRRRAAQRRPDRRRRCWPTSSDQSRSPSSPTACCWPASRCSCSRPCRRRCCRGWPARRPRRARRVPAGLRAADDARRSSSASSARRRVPARPVRRSSSSTTPTLSGRTLAMLALGSALLHGRPGHCPGGHRPARPRPRRARLDIGVVAFVLGTWLSSDDLFRRSRSAWSLSSPRVADRVRLRPAITPAQRRRARPATRCSKRSPTCRSRPERSSRRVDARRACDPGLLRPRPRGRWRPSS